MSEITKETSVADLVRQGPEARRIFDEHGLRGCGGAHAPNHWSSSLPSTRWT
jgi:hypothetical protein